MKFRGTRGTYNYSGRGTGAEDGSRDRTSTLGGDLKIHYDHGNSGYVRNAETTCHKRPGDTLYWETVLKTGV